MTITVLRDLVFVPYERAAADIESPYATGARVPTPNADGLCSACYGAWPCTRCHDCIAGLLP